MYVYIHCSNFIFFFFKQKTAYEMRISDWSSDVCSSDLDVKMAGKTGTAQVVSLSKGSGKGGLWKYRDHGLFIALAPFDAPRYAAAVVIEHGGRSGAAYPIARPVMTFLFARAIGRASWWERVLQYV